MSTQQRFTINGVIDTNQSVLDNLNDICSSAGAWFTFDNITGNWSVIINQAGNSVSSFDHSRILSGITVQGLGFSDLVNGVKITYPRTDIRDNTDYVQVVIPEASRNANEVENILELTAPLAGTQAQVQLMAVRELRQNRINRTISFETDYTALGLRAGDIIDVSSPVLGMNQELYRIVTITENDSADQGITFSITAVLYSTDIYDESGLTEYVISTETGIFAPGNIAAPITPQITAYAANARPHVVVETVVPAGRVEAMEFWMATGNSNNTYALMGTERAGAAGVLTEGEEITLDIDTVATGNIFVKTRGMNSTTTGPFSPVANLISYQSQQITDAIGNNTSILDSSGNTISTLLAIPALLKIFDQVVNGDTDYAAKTGVIYRSESIANLQTKFDAVFSSYTTNDGYDLGTVANNAVDFTFTTAANVDLMTINLRTPQGTYNYEYQDRTGNVLTGQLIAQPPFAINVYGPSNTLVTGSTVDWTTNSVVFNVATGNTLTAGNYRVNVRLIPTYDLDMNWSRGNLTSTEDVHEIYFTLGTVESKMDMSVQLFDIN